MNRPNGEQRARLTVRLSEDKDIINSMELAPTLPQLAEKYGQELGFRIPVTTIKTICNAFDIRTRTYGDGKRDRQREINTVVNMLQDLERRHTDLKKITQDQGKRLAQIEHYLQAQNQTPGS